MGSIPGASSLSLQLLKRPTSTNTASISLDNNRLSRLNTFLRANHNRPTVSFVISATATPNSSLLTAEEAFKGSASHDSKNNDQLGYDLEIDTPVTISKDELDISKLSFPSKLVDSLRKRGITNLFPIQRAVLLPAIEGRDIIARAKTGTGKTLAFGIPIIKGLINDEQSTQRRSGRLPKVLVLAPTRELAKQVDKEIQESAPYLNTICVYGGVSYVTQKSALLRGVDVVVGTPGRLIDLINGNCLKLSEIQYLVLDEADQMLAVGFEEDVEMILERVPSQRQVMLFSATMPGWVKKLSRKHLSNPLTIDLVGENEEKLAEGIKLYAISATAASKRTILPELISAYAKGGKTIVFTRTKKDADEVSFSLTNASQALHGDISQYQRERTLNGFRQGRFKVLVATDVAARGLDIPNVDLVIHFELPNDPETFVHRSGRTGRAGNEGTVVLMYTSSQKRTVNSLERDVGSKFEFIRLPAMEGISELSDDDEPPSDYSRRSPRDYYGRSSGYNRKSPSDYYGKFSDRDGSNRRGSGDRSSFKTSGDDWRIGGSRSSRGSGDRSSFKTSGDDWGIGGSRSSRVSGDRSSFKTSGDDWRIGGSQSSRGGSYGGGACFNCGQPGHRAAVCPQKR